MPVSQATFRKTGITKDKAVELAREFYPQMDADEQKELVAAIEVASTRESFSSALLELLGYDPRITLRLQRIAPWMPTADEAVFMEAFFPTYVNLLVMSNPGISPADLPKKARALAEQVSKETEKLKVARETPAG